MYIYIFIYIFHPKNLKNLHCGLQEFPGIVNRWLSIVPEEFRTATKYNSGTVRKDVCAKEGVLWPP